MMHSILYCLFASLVVLVSAQSAGRCRFGNGTLLPDDDNWSVYAPCPGADGPTTICCAIIRANPPRGNVSLGPTQDDCLPNGLCQNRNTDNGVKGTTWFVDFCTENAQPDNAGKCLNICPTPSYELTARITPCDGTANSTKWCCGTNKDCCQSGSGVISLEQVLGSVSSSVVSSSSLATITSNPTQTNTADSSSKKLSGGAIAGIVIGAVLGLALLAAVIIFASRAARRRKAANVSSNVAEAEAPYTSPMQEMGPTVKYAHAQELPGPPPGELQGDAPMAHTRTPPT